MREASGLDCEILDIGDPEGLLDQWVQQLHCVRNEVIGAKQCFGAGQRCWTITFVRPMLAPHLSYGDSARPVEGAT